MTVQHAGDAGSASVHPYQMKDVEKVTWKLKTDDDGVIQSTYAGFKGVLDDRRNLFKKVMSLLIHGVAVTPPSSHETYHIIEIEVDKKVVLQLLFRQSDCYWVAFRHVSTDGNPMWEGWYYFKEGDREVVLPSFCEEKVKLEIDSGYTGFPDIKIGRGIVSSIVDCLLAFNLQNCALTSFGNYNRVVLCETLMFLFGECQRSGLFLEFAEKHYESDTLVLVTAELSKHRNSWDNLSSALMNLYLGFLEQEHGVNGWETTVNYGVEQMAREVREFAGLGHNGIERFIEYHDWLDDEGNKVLKLTPLSMQNLLGSDVGQLLHLIKYNQGPVLKIHLALMKQRIGWPDSKLYY